MTVSRKSKFLLASAEQRVHPVRSSLPADDVAHQRVPPRVRSPRRHRRNRQRPLGKDQLPDSVPGREVEKKTLN